MNLRLGSDIIKKIAMFCMLIDHIGVGIIEKLYVVTLDADRARMLININQVLRAVGRIAFPIFCYQIAVGILRTRNRMKYVMRMLLFAFISEIPFDLLNAGRVLDMSYQNVMITLFLGTVTVICMDFFEEKLDVRRLCAKAAGNTAIAKAGGNTVIAKATINTVIATVFCLIAELLKTDYGAKGVILIVLFYFTKRECEAEAYISEASKMLIVEILFMLEVFVITLLRSKSMNATITYCTFEVYALLAFPLILADTGERKGGVLLKWAGYVFYPAHMLIIYLISLIVVG